MSRGAAGESSAPDRRRARVSSVFYPLIGEQIYGGLGKTIDVIAILGTLFGVAVSIGPLIQGLSVVIVAIFFATSSDSASLVVDMLCTGDEEPGPIRQRVFWGVAEGVVAAMLIVLAGEAGLTALQQVITVVGLPIFVMVFVMMFSLLKGFQSEQIGAHAIGAPPTKEELKS